eukprot:1028664-Heterocapsa_arctica.AAC.1
MALRWTDAMYMPPATAGMCLVLPSPSLPKPLAIAAVVPHAHIVTFLPRTQQIMQAEVFAGVPLLFNCQGGPDVLDPMHI